MENQLDYAGHRSWQIRQPAAQSKLREPFDVARAAPVIMILISDHVTIIINCVLTADFFAVKAH